MVQKAGLSAPNPFMGGSSFGTMANPFLVPSAGVSTGAGPSAGGLGSIPPPTFDSSNIDARYAALLQDEEGPLFGPQVFYSPSQERMYVNGLSYDIDDYQSAIEAEASGVLKNPPKKPPAGDWKSVSPESYNRYMQGIIDPGKMKLMGKNFKLGIDALQMLWGRSLQWAGFEDYGQKVVDKNVKQLYYNQPFQREFTSIDMFDSEDTSHGAIDWFVANLAQQGPNLLSSILMSLAGATIGAGMGGGPNPVTAAGGAILGWFGKKKVMNETLKAAQKYIKGGSLTNGEKKLLREWSGLAGAAEFKKVKPGSLITSGKAKAIRNFDELSLLSGAKSALQAGKTQARVGGAFIGANLFGYTLGIGDIYGEMRETGKANVFNIDASNNPRLATALMAFPYAAMETLTEFFVAGKLFGSLPNMAKAFRKNKKDPSVYPSGAGAASLAVAGRGAKGFTVGAIMEGMTEAAQEAIIMGSSDRWSWEMLTDPEKMNRLINGFAAGAAIGGAMGGVANLVNTKAPVDILKDEPVEGENPADSSDAPPSGPSPLDGQVLPPEGPPPLTPIEGTPTPLIEDEGPPLNLWMQPQIENQNKLTSDADAATAIDAPADDTPPPGGAVAGLLPQGQETTPVWSPDLAQPVDESLSPVFRDPTGYPIIDTSALEDSAIAPPITETTDLPPVAPLPEPQGPPMPEVQPFDRDTMSHVDMHNALSAKEKRSKAYREATLSSESDISLYEYDTNLERTGLINKLTPAQLEAVRQRKHFYHVRAQALEQVEGAPEQYKQLREAHFQNLFNQLDKKQVPEAVIARMEMAWEGAYYADEIDRFIGEPSSVLVEKKNVSEDAKPVDRFSIEQSQKLTGPGIIQKVIGYENKLLKDITAEDRDLVSLMSSRSVAETAAFSNKQRYEQRRDEILSLLEEGEAREEKTEAINELKEATGFELEKIVDNWDNILAGRPSRRQLLQRGTFQTDLMRVQRKGAVPIPPAKGIQYKETEVTEEQIGIDKTIRKRGKDVLRKRKAKADIQKRSAETLDAEEQTGTGEALAGKSKLVRTASGKITKESPKAQSIRLGLEQEQDFVAEESEKLRKLKISNPELYKLEVERQAREFADAEAKAKLARDEFENASKESPQWVNVNTYVPEGSTWSTEKLTRVVWDDLKPVHALSYNEIITSGKERKDKLGFDGFIKNLTLAIESNRVSPDVLKKLYDRYYPYFDLTVEQEVDTQIKEFDSLNLFGPRSVSSALADSLVTMGFFESVARTDRDTQVTAIKGLVDYLVHGSPSDLISNAKRRAQRELLNNSFVRMAKLNGPLLGMTPVLVFKKENLAASLEQARRIIDKGERAAQLTKLSANTIQEANVLAKGLEGDIEVREESDADGNTVFTLYQKTAWLKYALKHNLLDAIKIAIDEDYMHEGYQSKQAETIRAKVAEAQAEGVEGQSVMDMLRDIDRMMQKQIRAGEEPTRSELAAWQDAYTAVLGEKGSIHFKKAEQQLREEVSRVLEDRINAFFDLYKYRDQVNRYKTNPVVTLSTTNRQGDKAAEKTNREALLLEDLYRRSDKNWQTEKGYLLSDFFTEDGKIRLSATGPDNTVVPDPIPLKEEKQRLAKLKVEAATLGEQLKRGPLPKKQIDRMGILNYMNSYSQDFINDMDTSSDDTASLSKEDISGLFSRIEDDKPVNPLGRAEVRLLVKAFVKKLRLPKGSLRVTIVDSVEDLQKNHPELFLRARFGRPNDDFMELAKKAAGYSIGSDVIVFNRNIKDKRHLKTVLAHEILGHHGFKAFAPRGKLNVWFKEIYNSDGHIKAEADRLMEQYGMDMVEAVEEALAQASAALDTSILAKLGDLIASILTVIGGKTWISKWAYDDFTRYFIHQSRNNIRQGGSGFISAEEMLLNIKSLENKVSSGRFAMAETRSDHATSFFKAHGLNQTSGFRYGFAEGLRFLNKQKETMKERPEEWRRVVGEVGELVQTLDNKARRSEGLSQIFKIFQMQAGKTRRYLQQYESLTKFTNTPRWPWNKDSAPTPQDKIMASKLLAFANAYNANRYKARSEYNKMDDIIPKADRNDLTIDDDAIKALEEKGNLTREEFERGFTIPFEAGDEFVRFVDGPDKVRDLGKITDGAWTIYQENRRAVNQAAVDVLMASMNAIQNQKASAAERFRKILNRKGQTVTASDIAALDRIVDEYRRLYLENPLEDGTINPESSDKATLFIREINRAFHGMKKDKEGKEYDAGLEKRLDWKDPTRSEKAKKGFTSQFQGDRYTAIIESLDNLAELIGGESNAYGITAAIQDMYVLDTNAKDAQYHAKHTIMGSYVPFKRRGKWEIRLQAINPDTGLPVKLNEYYKSTLPYFQQGSITDAKDIQNELQGMTVNEDGSPIRYMMKDDNGDDIPVVLRAEVQKAAATAPLSNIMKIDEFMQILTKIGVSLNNAQRDTIHRSLKNAGEKIDSSLRKEFTIGWDQDVVRGVAEHLELQAHIAGKKEYGHMITDVMADNNLWLGDEKKLKDLEDAMNAPNLTQAQRADAERNYNEYAYMYRYSASKGKAKAKWLKRKKGTLTEYERVAVDNYGRGEDYRADANKLLEFYSRSDNILDSTEDILSNEYGSRLKLATVLAQLGGSVATALINLVSLVTHSVPFLSTYNPDKDYGGGFGFRKTSAELLRAARNIKHYKWAEYDNIVKLANDQNLQRQNNIEQDEAYALLEATQAGVLQAAQFNALVGTARGGIVSNRAQSMIKGWMSMFSYTEQMNRRTTFLAAYRMQRDRLKATVPNFDGLQDGQKQELFEKASAFASRAVNTSQGEYSMYNRPEMARGNWAQYIFMYKQFVITTVQLMKGLSPSGRMYMIAALFLMSGLKGLPFAEDIADLIDTLMQMFDIKWRGVELILTESAQAFIPEFMQNAPGPLQYGAPQVMKGVIDSWTGATVSTRLGLGDLVPLTGAWKAKSTSGDYWREATNFFGPVWSTGAGIVNTSMQLARYAGEKVGLKSGDTGMVSILRDNPVAAVRNLADGFTYIDTGHITRSNGSVIARDASWTEAALKGLLGFYPARATEENLTVKMVKDLGAYSSSFKQAWVIAWVKAAQKGDRTKMRSVGQEVNQHNKDAIAANLPEFVIRDFIGSAQKSLRTANLSASDRFKKSAGKNVQNNITTLQALYGL